MAKLRIGVIGLGRIGKIHLQNLLGMTRNVVVAGVVDTAAENRSWALEKGISPIFSDHRELLKLNDLDAVAVCSPTTTHLEVVKACCRRGVDIFCEKPLETSLEKILEIGKLAEESGVRVQVGFQRRFDPNFQRIREAIRSWQIGDIHLVNITSRDPEPPPLEFIRTSGGLFMDMAIHDLDMTRFLLGDEAHEVFVMADVLVDPEIGKAGDVDTAVITIRFKNRTLVHINNSRRAVYGYDQRVEVFGNKGMIQSYNTRPDHTVVHDSTGYHGPSPFYFFLERYADAYRREIEAFVETVLNDQPVQVGIHDAYRSTAMAIAVKRSLNEGRVVKLNDVVSESSG